MDDADSVTKLLEQEDALRQQVLRNRVHAKSPRKTCKECGIKLNRVRSEYGLCIDCAKDQEKAASARSI